MKIYILQKYNPYFTSSASANRLLSLIEGLLNLNEKVEIQLFITNGYQSQQEKKKLGLCGSYKKVGYKYLNTSLIDNIWQRRLQHYIGKHIQYFSVKEKMKNELKGFSGIVWPENDLKLWQLMSSISTKRFVLFTEMSEFLDIHHYNRNNALQRNLGDSKQKYFENIYIYKLDGFALMTKTLMSHYYNFDNHPPLLHLPMTVDFERFTENQAPPDGFDSPYIVFVGVMNNAKDGVDILIEAFAKIADTYSDLKLYLVGPWNYDTPAHLSRIKELKLIDRIIWKGEFPRDIIPSIIKNAKLLVLPRPDSKQAQGGFPTKLGEYLATANPVCATTVGELPLYLKDNESVFFAEPGSIDSFAETMNRALQNYKEAQKVGAKGREVAIKSFNKNIQGEILYNFFKQLIDENKK